MKKIVLLLVLGLPLFVLAQNIDTIHYSVLTTGKPSGKHAMWSSAPNSVSFFYEFNDRGRGPRLQVETITDGDGFVISQKVSGHDYFKAPVSESFEIANGTARWKNNIEQGEKKISRHALYSAINGTPAELELVMHALWKAEGHRVDVLPSGFMEVKHVKNHNLKVNGFSEEFELYSFTGAGGPPAYAWFTPKKKYFASVGGWMSTILEGYESYVDELTEAQKKIEDDYFETQEDDLTQVFKVPVAFTNVTVFNSVTGKNMSGQTVITENGKITAAGPSKKTPVPANAKVIDGTGKVLLPGLWDNHAHFSASQGLYHLAGGVTNIKDMANSLDLPETKKKVNTNELLGPDISIMSGFIDFAGPFAGPTGKIVKTLEEGLAAVNYYADHGYQQIKLYSSIPVDWVKPLAAEAHKRGMKVCGHVPSFMTAERAVKDGYDQIIHMNMVMLNFLGDTLDTRSMLRFIRVAERSKNIDLNSPQVKQFLKLLKERNVIIDPTVAIFEEMFTNEQGKLANGYEGVINQFPAEFRRGFYNGGLPTMKGHEIEYRQSFEKMEKMLQLL
ncbi:MAG: hypothetical protein K2U26_15050, partial [Cyclobacteriaceae bacterium]|nr:hypothetical protein [Cyclobacteriaceae bacterium]